MTHMSSTYKKKANETETIRTGCLFDIIYMYTYT